MAKEFGIDLAFNKDEERRREQEAKIKELEDRKREQEAKIKEKEKKIKELEKDPLTGLFTRAQLEPYFNDAKQKLEKGVIKALASVYLDINSFKELNDQYGHGVGDKALEVVANRLRSVTRKDDGLFRVGGDEFVAILEINDMGPQTVEDKKRRINDNLFIEVDGGRIPFSVSMGFDLILKGDQRTAQQVLKVADDKMYEDKANGKPLHVFEIDKRHITQN
jgi:diguanylate cyclase (GGDEF)-like protein